MAEARGLGIAGNVQRLYESPPQGRPRLCVPGAVFITGALLTVAYQNPWSGADGLGITALLLASYACGVLLRLFGTLSRVLIISAAHTGLLGDPWELAGSHGAISLRDRAWRTRHPAAQVELYKKYLDGDDERNSRVRQIVGRESLFVHIAGILGFALLVLTFHSFYTRRQAGRPYLCSANFPVSRP